MIRIYFLILPDNQLLLGEDKPKICQEAMQCITKQMTCWGRKWRASSANDNRALITFRYLFNASLFYRLLIRPSWRAPFIDFGFSAGMPLRNQIPKISGTMDPPLEPLIAPLTLDAHPLYPRAEGVASRKSDALERRRGRVNRVSRLGCLAPSWSET